jgi:hypothetical protein
MFEEHNSVQLQIANGHNLVVGRGYIWSRVGGTNHKTSDSAITYLELNPDQLMVAQSIFQIVDMQGAVLMDDSAIRARVRRR